MLDYNLLRKGKENFEMYPKCVLLTVAVRTVKRKL